MEGVLKLIVLSLLFMSFLSAVTAENVSYLPENPHFYPVYSQKMTVSVSPEKPADIKTEIRDSETGFFRIYAWGDDPNMTDFDLWTTPGNVSNPTTAQFNSSTTGYPEVITVTNTKSEYLQVDPGEYTTRITSSAGSGEAEIHVLYVYHKNIDMGDISNKDYSVWEAIIPPGLSRIIIITESVMGTDLDLFIQKGTTLPDSFEKFDYISASNCTQCWDTGIENWVAEMIIIDYPEPGPYLMVTSAHGGDDFFMTYWMGILNDSTKEKGSTRNQDQKIKTGLEVAEKYADIPFRILYSASPEEDMNSNFSVPAKAYMTGIVS